MDHVTGQQDQQDPLSKVLLVDDCLDWLRSQPDQSVDLVMTSPPYEDARFYGIQFKLKGQAWVDWAVERFLECYRVSRGLTCWVMEGRTRSFRWSATPALFMADLHRRGVQLRKPPIYHRVGIPGSGGPDWWRNDYEWCVCASHGRLPWSNNTATGQPAKYEPGGAMSHRRQDGRRVSWGGGAPNGYRDGDIQEGRPYHGVAIANPGNVIHCAVGGGKMGHPLSHENEAPFPEALVEPFVLSFCPPGGIVLDPFCGSGTTLAVANKHGRRAIGLDIRDSQVGLATSRVADTRYTPTLAV